MGNIRTAWELARIRAATKDIDGVARDLTANLEETPEGQVALSAIVIDQLEGELRSPGCVADYADALEGASLALRENTFNSVAKDYSIYRIPLSEAEEHILITQLQDDKARNGAREQLLQYQMAYLFAQAYSATTRYLRFSHLALIGFTNGIRVADALFDPTTGLLFSQYAAFWVDQAIAQEVGQQRRCVKCGVKQAFHAQAL